MTLAAQVAHGLRAGRGLGLPFDDAWQRVIRGLPRITPAMAPGDVIELQEWRQAVRWAKPYYRAAYHYEQLVGGAASIHDRAA